MDKSIDHNRVADLYDIYVDVDFDIEFWRQETSSSGGSVLELMCGTGRIGLRLIERGVPYTGVDYCRRLLDRFEMKLPPDRSGARLVHDDARTFDLGRTYDLVFIAFHSLSEVLDDGDKLKVLERVRAHLRPDGRFVFSLHHPATRARELTGERLRSRVFELDGGRRRLEFAHRFRPPSPEGIVCGQQFYIMKDRAGRLIKEQELEVRFHLISKEGIESLLARSGFRIVQLWGNYDRSEFGSQSPYMIYRCLPMM